ncbi:hypothetical protein C8F04DRAFT_1172420 [Mycena alexandri]|uniref:Uncharacterized protein n=1 Tax=Mycena alexandri TaxID=1745969 RepID=A0AAD6TPI5_9AGAR|nr:hypothetical protein C8F04DRAFT_1172420 [Mycena alexandri]
MGHEDLVDTLQSVEEIINHLPLLSVSDSPCTKSTWEKLLHLCHGVSLEITTHHTDMLAIMAEEVNEEENEEEDPQQAGGFGAGRFAAGGLAGGGARDSRGKKGTQQGGGTTKGHQACTSADRQNCGGQGVPERAL